MRNPSQHEDAVGLDPAATTHDAPPSDGGAHYRSMNSDDLRRAVLQPDGAMPRLALPANPFTSRSALLTPSGASSTPESAAPAPAPAPSGPSYSELPAPTDSPWASHPAPTPAPAATPPAIPAEPTRSFYSGPSAPAAAPQSAPEFEALDVGFSLPPIGHTRGFEELGAPAPPPPSLMVPELPIPAAPVAEVAPYVEAAPPVEAAPVAPDPLDALAAEIQPPTDPLGGMFPGVLPSVASAALDPSQWFPGAHAAAPAAPQMAAPVVSEPATAAPNPGVGSPWADVHAVNASALPSAPAVQAMAPAMAQPMTPAAPQHMAPAAQLNPEMRFGSAHAAHPQPEQAPVAVAPLFPSAPVNAPPVVPSLNELDEADSSKSRRSAKSYLAVTLLAVVLPGALGAGIAYIATQLL